MLAFFGNFFSKIFGSRNERLIKRMGKSVQAINALEPEISKLSDDALRQKTEAFKKRYQDGETLDELLPEAFAVVREAGKRVLNMRHFDVQLIGGMVLHQGKISEMRTGEGKTLVATLAAYLNALTGKGVHVVTVNDYLATRDAGWMGKIYRFLGMEVGVILSGQSPAEKQKAYGADITYGTNNEFGFDYLRDNMEFAAEHKMQRELNFAIVDEVDSILIDEARTPLIISGAAEDSTDLYRKVNSLPPKLTKQEKQATKDDEEEGPGDYAVDEKTKQVYLTEAGHERVEQLLLEEGLLEEGESLYDPAHVALFHHINAAMRAHYMYHKDVDYVINNKEIIIVDEFTGRTMPGRRWSDGLHQAIEAKEKVPIQQETQTLASITFQNYFRLYNKLSGMTGTADTEAFEFQQIYGLEVVVIPTHRPMVRKDMGDLVYLTPEEKYRAIIEDIKDCRQRQQPVLVGTTSIETSELLSRLLRSEKIDHQVLNAKQHEKEAEIVAHAGRPGAVTIATNMAGRGTDIVLGGQLEDEDDEEAKAQWRERHEQVLKAGGLHIVGTERHESRRIDNQLRGRSGRQGDPGSSRFYLSLKDNLMRIFAPERMSGIMQKLGMKEGEAIEHPWVSKAIENAQRKVEGHHFDMRKQLLKYDDVANEQRRTIYEHRNELMGKEDVSERIKEIRADVIRDIVATYIPPQSMEEQWDLDGLQTVLGSEFEFRENIKQWLEQDHDLHEETLLERILSMIEEKYAEKEAMAGSQAMRSLEKQAMLYVLDSLWKDHLNAMDYLRQSIQFYGYAQKNPEQEYKTQAFKLFGDMLSQYKQDVVSLLSRVKFEQESQVQELERKRPEQMNFIHPSAEAESMPADREYGGEPQQEAQAPYVRQERKVGRNEPCPCGSGKKYKQCHGKL